MRIQIINGPNLNLVGIREPDIYGTTGFDTFIPALRKKYPNATIDYFQSNIEGELIDKLQQVGFQYDGILLNAGGFTHTSIAIGDAIAAISTPVLAIHISNILNREEYRHTDLLTGKCCGMITGLGLSGYDLGIQYFLSFTT